MAEYTGSRQHGGGQPVLKGDIVRINPAYAKVYGEIGPLEGVVVRAGRSRGNQPMYDSQWADVRYNCGPSDLFPGTDYTPTRRLSVHRLQLVRRPRAH